MMRMEASLRKVSALRLRFSQSLANRRQRLSQAMVRSTSQLLHERPDDYDKILQTLIWEVQNLPQLVDYIQGWARGHFIQEALTLGGSVSP